MILVLLLVVVFLLLLWKDACDDAAYYKHESDKYFRLWLHEQDRRFNEDNPSDPAWGAGRGG